MEWLSIILIADTFLHINSDEFVKLDERNFGKSLKILPYPKLRLRAVTIPEISSTEMKPLLFLKKHVWRTSILSVWPLSALFHISDEICSLFQSHDVSHHLHALLTVSDRFLRFTCRPLGG